MFYIKIIIFSISPIFFLPVISSTPSQYMRDPSCPECQWWYPKCSRKYKIKMNGYDNCYCLVCLARCGADSCPAGKECYLEQLPTCPNNETPCKYKTANCRPFSYCKPLPKSCSLSCKMSGFVKDFNNCDFCECNDVCKEAACMKDEVCVRYAVKGHPIRAHCRRKPTLIAD